MNELGMSWFFSFTFLLLIHKVSVQSVPVEGIIGQTVILPCKLKQKPQTVFWRYRDDRTVCDFLGGEADFDEQDPAYKDRVEIFPSEIEKGNFSIMLSNVKKSDEGTYTCIATNLTPLTVELTVKGLSHHVIENSVAKSEPPGRGNQEIVWLKYPGTEQNS
ncbi:CD276 antigen homolog isoform X4 [Pangasianodon hypophthalmus]|uniref:CD276 antigen homolog isoform X4 n=1 Tax=Pangasianodon hypophthalmus TaxID=310915 RepID=UPI0023078CE0|nr:CD276 antigen homolog isoform X4 [Pangasianodon hypophthalmus]